MSKAVAAANSAIESEDDMNLLNCLLDPNMLLHSVTPQCAEKYLCSLKQYKREKALTGNGVMSTWLLNEFN